MKLTVQELATIIEVTNIRSNRNCTIKDLRLIDDVVKMLMEQMPQAPVEPTDKTPEALEAYKKECDEYHTYEIEVDIRKTALDVIKIKLSNTNVFFDDKATRERVLALADKLGL